MKQQSSQVFVLLMTSKLIFMSGICGETLKMLTDLSLFVELPLPVISVTHSLTLHHPDPQARRVFLIMTCFHCRTQGEQAASTGSLWRMLNSVLHNISYSSESNQIKWKMTWVKYKNRDLFGFVSSGPICHRQQLFNQDKSQINKSVIMLKA